MNDLTGERFGWLTVLERDTDRKKRKYWKCQCDCGAIAVVEEGHLKSGHTKSCGCYRKRQSSERTKDLTGRQYGRLEVLEQAGSDANGVRWRCRCTCCKITVCYGEYLQRGITRSCGCLQEESRKRNMEKAIHFINGTCVERIQAGQTKKRICTNRSGYRGVYQRENGKWRAEITFQGRRYRLGTFESPEEARQARESIEKELWVPFLENYGNLGNREMRKEEKDHA